jgi:hypothetical protein
MFVDRLIITSLANFILIIVYIAQITILLVIGNLKLISLLILSCKLAIQTNN